VELPNCLAPKNAHFGATDEIESVTGQKPSSRLSLWRPKVKNMSYRKRLGSRFLPVVLAVEPSRL
jgi:hypothetical protein